jgi:hypothetical protein
MTALIARRNTSPDATFEPPSFLRWEDGSPATQEDYRKHSRTHMYGSLIFRTALSSGCSRISSLTSGVTLRQDVGCQRFRDHLNCPGFDRSECSGRSNPCRAVYISCHLSRSDSPLIVSAMGWNVEQGVSESVTYSPIVIRNLPVRGKKESECRRSAIPHPFPVYRCGVDLLERASSSRHEVGDYRDRCCRNGSAYPQDNPRGRLFCSSAPLGDQRQMREINGHHDRRYPNRPIIHGSTRCFQQKSLSLRKGCAVLGERMRLSSPKHAI